MFYSVNDGGVGAAPTEVRRWAFGGVRCLDLGVGGIGIFFQEFRGDHHHAVLAEAAKRSLFFDPGLLDGVKYVFWLAQRRKTFSFAQRAGSPSR